MPRLKLLCIWLLNADNVTSYSKKLPLLQQKNFLNVLLKNVAFG